MTVIRAELADVLEAAQLFAAYREFYGEPYDTAKAGAFLAARIVRDESIVLLGLDDDEVVGFAQIYPSFSSTRLTRVWAVLVALALLGVVWIGVVGQLMTWNLNY